MIESSSKVYPYPNSENGSIKPLGTEYKVDITKLELMSVGLPVRNEYELRDSRIIYFDKHNFYQKLKF